ncbi:MAG: hypothetical protein JWM20_677 [Patescibacteria group bacterium]|nr:hypothetical protein [Patescibacteria group bacterium]
MDRESHRLVDPVVLKKRLGTVEFIFLEEWIPLFPSVFYFWKIFARKRTELLAQTRPVILAFWHSCRERSFSLLLLLLKDRDNMANHILLFLSLSLPP